MRLWDDTQRDCVVDLEAYIGEDGLEQLRHWANAKEARNRRMSLYCLDNADDFFQEAYCVGLELVARNVIVCVVPQFMLLEMTRIATKALIRAGTTHGQGGDELPMDPEIIEETVLDFSGTQREEWFLFQRDAKRVLCESNPVLWDVLKWFLKKHPISRREYEKERKRRKRLPADWGEGENTPVTPGFTVAEIAKKCGVHRNTVINYRMKIKNLLKQHLSKDYKFLQNVLYIVEMA